MGLWTVPCGPIGIWGKWAVGLAHGGMRGKEGEGGGRRLGSVMVTSPDSTLSRVHSWSRGLRTPNYPHTKDGYRGIFYLEHLKTGNW